MAWVRHDPNELVRAFEWVMAVAIIGQVLARGLFLAQDFLEAYLAIPVAWVGATLLLTALAKLLWADGCLTLSLMSVLDFLPLDPYRLKYFLILVGLVTIPLARLGFAPSALATQSARRIRGKG